MRFQKKGFGLLEVILVFAIVLGAAAVIFSVFDAAHTRATASAEATYVRSVMASVDSVFPGHSYVGATTWWNKARAAKQGWAQNPEGFYYTVSGYDPTNGNGCGGGACPTLSMNVFYRDYPSLMTEDQCEAFFVDLARDFFIYPGNLPSGSGYNSHAHAGQKPTPLSPNKLSSYCDRDLPSVPMYFKIIKPF